MKRVAIVVNYTKLGAAELARKVCAQLEDSGMNPLIIMGSADSPVGDDQGDYAQCDAVIAIGGDGTILNAARRVLPHDIPVLGINAGRMGFLAGLERHEIDLLSRLSTGEYQLEHRMLLEACVLQGGQLVHRQFCINDAVISRFALSRPVEIPVICDEHSLSYLGDGVIFSTPTGSTAYGFSAGGPVVDPQIETILLTPICNHRLFDRTVVFAADKRVKAKVLHEGMALVVDGEAPFHLSPGQMVEVRRAEHSIRFIRLKTQSFLDILSQKLIEN